MTVNDVLVATTTAASAAVLADRPGGIRRLHALVPVDLRRGTAGLGNRFGLLLLELPLEADHPVERLYAVARRTRRLKASGEARAAMGLLAAMGAAPTAIEAQLVAFFSDKASMVLTNVRGPTRPVVLAGVPVDAVHVWAPASGSIGLSTSVLSYAGRVHVGFLANRALDVPPWALARAFPAALAQLAAWRTGPPRPATPGDVAEVPGCPTAATGAASVHDTPGHRPDGRLPRP